MGFIRITTISVLMLGAAAVLPQSAKAGFEIIGSGATAAAAPSQALLPEDSIDAPMPIVPTADVTAVPLDGDTGSSAKPDVDHVLQLPVSYQPEPTTESQPVYIRRQRNALMKAPKNQPMDTEALLKATENGDQIALDDASMAANITPAAGGNDSGMLVIDPYPLASADGATHGGGMGTLAAEQMMMEQSGALRPVAVPGKKGPGMIERAKISSRHDSSTNYMERVPVQDDAAVFGIAPSITPIPGGEGRPLDQIAVTPLPPPSATPPRMPDSNPYAQAPSASSGQYTEAVGFGRDLPLALALSQIVPPEYSFAFGSNVDAGSTVSWQGGKAWNQVLDEMLQSQGMRAVISGKQVTIVQGGQSA